MRIKFGEWETTMPSSSKEIDRNRILYYQNHPEEFIELMEYDLHLLRYQKLWLKFLAKIRR